MFRILSSVLRSATKCAALPQTKIITNNTLCNYFHNPIEFQLQRFSVFAHYNPKINVPLFSSKLACKDPSEVQARSFIKFSRNKGKRKTVKAVLKRFYRLDWGVWIRTYCGRQKKLWRKTESRRRRLRQHVFCNGTQSWLLDTLVSKSWKRPKYFVDNPYEPYHKRENFPITRKKPIEYLPKA